MVSSVSLFCHTLPVRHSRAGGNLMRWVDTVASVPGTGDSRLRGSDVKVFKVLPALVRHTLPVRHSSLFLSHSRAGGNLTESTAKYPAGTVVSVPGTGDSCLRRSDVKELRE